MLNIATKWFQKYPGVVRVPVFESENSKEGYFIVYNERKQTYNLIKFDSKDGATLTKTMFSNGGYGAPLVKAGLVLIPTGFSRITCFSIKFGEVIWELETGARVRGSPQFDGENFCITSGAGLYFVNGKGEITCKIQDSKYIFFGEPLLLDNKIYTLGTFHWNGYSHVSLICFSKRGQLLFSTDLGEGNIVSSDTSGITLLHNQNIALSCSERVFCLDKFSGKIIWQANVQGFAARHKLIADDTHVYVTTLLGYVGTLKIDTGERVWFLYYKIAPTTPVQLIDEMAVFVADGYLIFLYKNDGKFIDRKAVGHSPYSLPVLHGNYLYLGAGEPPYEGLLWCFELNGLSEKKLTINAKENSCYNDSIKFDLNLSISGDNVLSVIADFSVISPENQVYTVENENNCFYFHSIPIKSNASTGIYIIPLKILTERKCYYDSVIIELKARKKYPSFKLIHDVPLISQREENFSGAAVVQAASDYFQKISCSQSEIRKSIDFVKNKSGYHSFDTWRILLRRVLNSPFKTAKELSEYDS